MFLASTIHITAVDLVLGVALIVAAIIGLRYGASREQMQNESKHNHK